MSNEKINDSFKASLVLRDFFKFLSSDIILKINSRSEKKIPIEED